MRGDAEVWAENTLSAFRGSFSLGYRRMETDVHLTADGVVVAFHDDRLDRVTDATGCIREFTAEELERVVVAGCERVPRLEALLSEFPDVRFSIDPKSDEVVDPLGDLLERLGALDRVCVGAFSDERIRRLRSRFGDRLCIAGGPAAVLAWAEAVVSQSAILDAPNLYAVPTHFGDAALITPESLAAAHDAGAAVHVWTVDEAEQMHALFDLGVDGIITDRPEVLREVLRGRGNWL